MSIAYTNRKGFTFYLCEGVTKTGKPRYFFAREPKGKPVEKIPDGFGISESVNGVVSLTKIKPMAILPSEVAAIEAAVRRHPKSRNYRVSVKHDRIEVYERAGTDPEELLKDFKREGWPILGMDQRIEREFERYSQFTPVLRFILEDADTRTFKVERMCYLGSIDGWLDVHWYDTAEKLARRVIPRLGTDGFFEMY